MKALSVKKKFSKYLGVTPTCDSYLGLRSDAWSSLLETRRRVDKEL